MLRIQLERDAESIWFGIDNQDWEISPEAFQQLCIGMEKFEQSNDSSKIIYLDLSDDDFDNEE